MARSKARVGSMGCWAVAAVAAAMLGCGGSNPTPPRPDAFEGVDAFEFSRPDSGGGGTPLDAGVDAPSTRMCRSRRGSCDLLRQDCPPGEACYFALPSEGATEPQTVCAPIVGAGAEEGQPCCALNSCDRGLVCADAVRMGDTCTTMGRCVRYCCGSSSDCSPGEVCNPFGSDFAGGQCSTIDGCDLIEQTGCEGRPETACYPSMGASTQCISPTMARAEEGSTCTYTNDCVPGTACFTVSAGGSMRSICLRFCHLADGAADCPNSMGMTCRAAGGLPSGVGICPPVG